mgnify:FL=1
MNSTQLENKKILNLNENIFRAYDIRGIAYTDLSKDVVINIGRAIARKVKKNNQNQLIIGRDGRNSSPDMASFLKSGISQEGCNIIDLGIVPTPALYFATYKLESNCAIMITGSHNPSNYNGFKIVINNKALSAEEIQEIKYSILDEYRTPVKLQNIEENQIQILDQYLKSIVNNIHLKKPLNIVIDCGNGAASVIAKEVFEKLGCNVKPLFCELDGNFPNHHPDPSKEENMKDLVSEVKRTSADLGLAFDGDADRLGVVSSSGEIISADRLMILFSQDVLRVSKGGNIVFDVKCSKLLPQAIREKGGNPVISKTGHSFIKNKIQEVNALLGGEMSGHIFFNDRWPGFDDGIYAGARLLEIISQFNEDPLQTIPKLFATPEINIEVTDSNKFQIVEKFKSNFKIKKTEIITIDGIRVEFKNGWGLLRASNTSAILVLRFEADSKNALNEISDIFKKELGKIDKKLMNF